MPTDKASNNVAFICIKYYVEVILREIIADDKMGTILTVKLTIQPENTCSKLAIETLEQGVKCVQS